MAGDLEGQHHYASTLLSGVPGWETNPDAVQARNIIASLMLLDFSAQEIQNIAEDSTGLTLKHRTDHARGGFFSTASGQRTLDEDQLRAIQELNEAYLRPAEDHEPIFRIVRLAIASTL